MTDLDPDAVSAACCPICPTSVFADDGSCLCDCHKPKVTPGHPVKAGAGYDCSCGECLASPDNSAAPVLAVVKKPHDDLGGDDFHQWITFDERVKADRNGRLNPNMMWRGNWVKWFCNNTECTAWALVSDESGLLAIEEAESV